MNIGTLARTPVTGWGGEGMGKSSSGVGIGCDMCGAIYWSMRELLLFKFFSGYGRIEYGVTVKSLLLRWGQGSQTTRSGFSPANGLRYIISNRYDNHLERIV
ncbi:hypothetical protein AVEN_193193-1 [Araneus ventricosus]|uniref:Uncharacterized protein n=1 Tax=Araneus ventricosus TaxID=182803 RepID=A0A4Y2B170_ARAVE|nr:hypothetical protein AVEN_193193-1 [Araneus ventricosus]